MAITKAITKPSKSHGGLRNTIEYVLKDEKVKDGFVYMSGPAPDQITWDSVYQSMLEEKKIWNKDTGRMYSHNVISFHKDEAITPDQALEFGKEFAEKWFAGFQTLIGVHQDREHIHIHFVTNSVSYEDGKKYHTCKSDLQHMKEITNDMCRDRGLTIAEKGKHFDGTAFEQGEVSAWTKDKYKLLQNDQKKSFVVDCAIAVMETKEKAASKDEFIREMGERGWSVSWSDKRKHITFENQDGKKVRDSNLEKTFNLDLGKETLLLEFERQNAERKAERDKAERERAAREADEREIEQYYAEVESAINGVDPETSRSLETGDGSARQTSEGRETGGPGDDTESLIGEIRAEISDNRTQNRDVRDAEKQSVAIDKQSHTRAAERRAAEQQRAENERAARELRRKTHHSLGFDR